jgi:hypothetical protein
MKWIEAIDELPTKRDSYLCIDKLLDVKRLLFFNKDCPTKKSLLITTPERYKWLDLTEEPIEKQIIQLLTITKCHNLLQVIEKFKQLQP